MSRIEQWTVWVRRPEMPDIESDEYDEALEKEMDEISDHLKKTPRFVDYEFVDSYQE